MSCLDCHKCPEYHDETLSDRHAVEQALKILRTGAIKQTMDELELIVIRLDKRHQVVMKRYEERV